MMRKERIRQFISGTIYALGFALLYAVAWWGLDRVVPDLSSPGIVEGAGVAIRFFAGLIQALVYGTFLGLGYWWVRGRMLKRRHHRIVARRLAEICV